MRIGACSNYLRSLLASKPLKDDSGLLVDAKVFHCRSICTCAGRVALSAYRSLSCRSCATAEGLHLVVDN
jgi:hypothetical protein